MIKVFVYGTLMQGFGNNYLLRSSKFLGKAVTAFNYQMYQEGIPYVAEGVKSKFPVKGELYEVNEDTLMELDYLEGFNENDYSGSWYKRKLISVIDDNNQTHKAYIYFNEPLGSIIADNDYRKFREKIKSVTKSGSVSKNNDDILITDVDSI